MKIIDVHTHAFPDNIAETAIPLLEKEGNISTFHNGTLDGLLSSMDNAGIRTSVLASIATKPEQYKSILKWSREISSERILPFPSIHPEDPRGVDHIHEIADSGFKGIKLHPYYQNFSIDESGMMKIYRTIADRGLTLLFHTGFDMAFPRKRIADPEKVIRILDTVPDLIIIASHFGGWKDWDEVSRHLLGKPVYLDISFSIDFLGRQKSEEFISRHSSDFLLFGSDSPWADQKRCVDQFLELPLEKKLQEKILFRNAERLFDLD